MRLARACLVLVLAVISFFALPTAAQIPQRMNYQVMLTDDADQPLADQSVQLVFRVYDQSAGGGQLWTETHNETTNSVGVVSVVLGETNPLAISFDGPLWLQVEVGGEVLSPRRELVSAPYALSGGSGAGEIMDVPGVASDISVGCAITSSVASAASRTIVAPSNGYILAIGTAQIQINHSGTLQTSVMVGLTDAFPNHASSQNSTVTVDANQPEGFRTHLVTVQGIFSASPSQAKTIHLFVQKVQGAYDSDCFMASLSLLFVPTYRGTEETIDAPTGLNAATPDSGVEDVLVPRGVLDELMSRVEELERRTGETATP